MLKIGQAIEFKKTYGWKREIVFAVRPGKTAGNVIYSSNESGKASLAIASGYTGFDSLWMAAFPKAWRIAQ
jgi:hypothetical protein